VRTPWGDAGNLRERQLSPGRGQAREEVRRNQRERLFAALVAVAVGKDYPEMSVADLASLSGVSSRSFYQLFADREACLLATMEEILGTVEAVTYHALAAAAPQRPRVHQAIDTFIAVIAAQPAAARLCMVTALGAGERPRARMDALIGEFAATMQAALEEMPDHDGMPPELTEAILGGIAIVLYHRLAAGEFDGIESLAPGLRRWALGVPAPPRPLRPRRRRGSRSTGSPPFTAHLPAEQILRAYAAVLAEKGYAGTTIADVAARARISQNTFYKHFEDRRAAFLAAVDSSGAQLVAATVPALRRDGCWPSAVRTGLEAACAFFVAEPAFAHLRQVEVFAVGPEAVRQRDVAIGEVVGLIAEMAPAELGLDPLAVEASVGAFQALLYRRIRHRDFAALAEVPPLVMYLVLAPSLGAEQAWEAAVG
jgi:AcrR family transcriptional regulator